MLICILAHSFGFHAITLERSTLQISPVLNQARVALNPVSIATYFATLLHAVKENKGTDTQADRQTDTQTNKLKCRTLGATLVRILENTRAFETLTTACANSESTRTRY